MNKSFSDFEKMMDSPEMEFERSRVFRDAYDEDKKRREAEGENTDDIFTMILVRDRATAAVSRFELRKYHEWMNG